MIVYSPTHGQLVSRTPYTLGDATNDLTPAEIAAYRNLHNIAAAIYDLQQRIIARVNAVGKDATVYAMVSDLQGLRAQFAYVAEEFAALNPNADLGWLDDAVLAVGDWVDGVLQALPGAVAAIPNALIEALSTMVQKLGKEATKSVLWLLVPLGVVGAALYFGTRKLETTRTFRKYVA